MPGASDDHGSRSPGIYGLGFSASGFELCCFWDVTYGIGKTNRNELREVNGSYSLRFRVYGFPVKHLFPFWGSLVPFCRK